MAAVPHCRGDAQAGTICDPTLPTFRVSAVRHSSCPAGSFAFLLFAATTCRVAAF